MTKPNPNIPPEPDSKRAMLVSAGYHTPRPTWTVHHWLRTELAVFQNPDGTSYRAWAFVWRCFKTGAERRWGTERTAEDAVLEEAASAQEAN